MSNEELEQMMQFIIKQHENFSEQMEQLRASHTRGEARLTRLESAFVNLYNTVSDLAKSEKRLNEAQAETTRNLNALILIVEQHLSGGQNGKA